MIVQIESSLGVPVLVGRPVLPWAFWEWVGCSHSGFCFGISGVSHDLEWSLSPGQLMALRKHIVHVRSSKKECVKDLTFREKGNFINSVYS